MSYFLRIGIIYCMIQNYKIFFDDKLYLKLILDLFILITCLQYLNRYITFQISNKVKRGAPSAAKLKTILWSLFWFSERHCAL